ncbi:MAG: hypothetical protein EPO09_20800 [Aquabacterium sp.]|uniref:hypothetical protein n=1 Tax=Aquabacterium sp. TaxID=1872578 RepID=UPI0011F6CB93|nr:hypothetical protein [Aquabacterium sp.]TAK84516.1 MAG: hypothetical protein EPO09_20800 [Aquabacterium sp.]
MPQALVIQSVDSLERSNYAPGLVVNFPAEIVTWLKSRMLVDDTPAVVAAAIAAGATQVVHRPNYSAKSGAMPKTSQAIAMVLAGLAQAFVGGFGDSTELGTGAGTGVKGLIGAAAGRPSAQMAAYLASVGIPAADNSFFGEGFIQAFPPNMQFSDFDSRFRWIAGASHYPNGQQTSLGGVMGRANGVGLGVGFTPTYPCEPTRNIIYDTVRVVYCDRTTGSITVSNPGGGSVASTITTDGTFKVKVATVSLTRGSGECQILCASGDVWIIGATFYDSQIPRVNIMSFGQYGDKLTSATGAVKNTNEWRGGAVLAQLGLDACWFDMTLNSYGDGLAGVSAFSDALRSIVKEVAAAGTETVIASPHAVGTGNQGTVSNAYVQAARQVTSETGSQFHDVYKRLTPYAAYSATHIFGGDGTTLHLSAGGNHAKGVLRARFLLNATGHNPVE